MTVNADVAELLELLACPACRSTVVPTFAGIGCSDCGRAYGLDGNVPVMGLDDDADDAP
jgi:uncharacterized protein YbaR (Trm112 family)